MKKIIVTGCNGQLGRAINAQYAESTEYELVNTATKNGKILKINKIPENTIQKIAYSICSLDCLILFKI